MVYVLRINPGTSNSRFKITRFVITIYIYEFPDLATNHSIDIPQTFWGGLFLFFSFSININFLKFPSLKRRHVYLQVNHGRDAFLVLTTDGINCVMSDQEICDVVRRTEDPMEAAHSVTDHAVQYSSEDNATAVVVPLGSWGNNASNASIFYSFGRSMTVSSRFS